MTWITARSKAIAAAISMALLYAAMYYGTNKYVSIAIAVAGVLGVHAVPNPEEAEQVPEIASKPVDAGGPAIKTMGYTGPSGPFPPASGLPPRT
jgi:hypothetical protein